MLTSKNSRRTGSTSSSEHFQDALLPLWLRDTGPFPQAMTLMSENGELWTQKRQSEAATRDSIAEFLLPNSS